MNRRRPPSDGGRVGFYLQMANEPKATLELIRSVRVHFPDAPLSVTSDAGSYDCSAACETYGCVFTREDTTAGMPAAAASGYVRG